MATLWVTLIQEVWLVVKTLNARWLNLPKLLVLNLDILHRERSFYEEFVRFFQCTLDLAQSNSHDFTSHNVQNEVFATLNNRLFQVFYFGGLFPAFFAFFFFPHGDVSRRTGVGIPRGWREIFLSSGSFLFVFFSTSPILLLWSRLDSIPFETSTNFYSYRIGG